jgi:catechol 2,3-dioxygenase-like lactoylglutathione lyase family enzyme
MNTATLKAKEISNTQGTQLKLDSFAHVSFPCRDLEEGRRFYVGVLGAVVRVDTPTFLSFRLAGVDIGIGTEGLAWPEHVAEYPHAAFFVDAANFLAARQWLPQCGIPISEAWTRSGVEALMFFRDPSGNLIELFCKEGVPGVERLPRSGPAGHGKTVDLGQLWYERWQLPGG